MELVEIQSIIPHHEQIVLAGVNDIWHLNCSLNLPLSRYFLGTFGCKHVDVSDLVSPEHDLLDHMYRY
jgi:hypothetical protein